MKAKPKLKRRTESKRVNRKYAGSMQAAVFDTRSSYASRGDLLRYAVIRCVEWNLM